MFETYMYKRTKTNRDKQRDRQTGGQTNGATTERERQKDTGNNRQRTQEAKDERHRKHKIPSNRLTKTALKDSMRAGAGNSVQIK